MTPAADPSRYQSRKFLIAAASQVVAAVGFIYGLDLSITSADVAIVFGAYGVVNGSVIKMYNDANLAGRK